MAKQSNPKSAGPSIGSLPDGTGADAQLMDFLTGSGPSAMPPVAPSREVGLPGLPKGK